MWIIPVLLAVFVLLCGYLTYRADIEPVRINHIEAHFRASWTEAYGNRTWNVMFWLVATIVAILLFSITLAGTLNREIFFIVWNLTGMGIALGVIVVAAATLNQTFKVVSERRSYSAWLLGLVLITFSFSANLALSAMNLLA